MKRFGIFAVVAATIACGNKIAPPAGGSAPSILSVVGDGIGGRVHGGVIITGANLTNGAVQLSSGATIVKLVTDSATATRLAAHFTEPVDPRNYTLTVTTSAGSAAAPLQLLQGEMGPTGAQGTAGPPGPTGSAGTPGITGPQGAQGPSGPAGIAGTNGSNGAPGAAGTSGSAGVTGPAGATGPMGPTGVVDPATAIANGTGPQSASFNITGAATIGTSLTLGGTNIVSTYPFFRITSNQILTGTQTGTNSDTVSGWTINSGGCGVALKWIQTVSNGVLWANRTPEEQALLTAMGRPNIQYVANAFNIYRMSWSAVCPWTFYQHIPNSPQFTVAAFTKLESGVITGWWATGIQSSWSLTGVHAGASAEGYSHPHPATSSVTGSLLIAMPAYVPGYVDLTQPINWGWFPYVSADVTQ